MEEQSVIQSIDEIQGKVLKCERVVTPSADAAKYEPYYDIYKKLYAANKDIFAQLNALR